MVNFKNKSYFTIKQAKVRLEKELNNVYHEYRTLCITSICIMYTEQFVWSWSIRILEHKFDVVNYK